MRGKGNYKQNRITKQIESLQNKYKKVGNTKVIYCIDTDQFDKKTDDKRILNEIEFFCNWKTITKKQFKTAIKGIEKGKKMTIKIPF